MREPEDRPVDRRRRTHEPAAHQTTSGQKGSGSPAAGGPFDKLPADFDRYRVEKLLGRGAMGAVYLASDLRLERQVALKIPKITGSGKQRVIQRLQTEAKAAAQLDHPCLCSVYDAGEVDGQCFIAMQYVEGETLKAQLARRKKSISEAVGLILQLAEGLLEAHALGIIHRDLKPENIMVNRRGTPVIMDFGLAKLTADLRNATATQAGTILGSPAYMSPEQASGNTQDIDQRSDIYALGTIFFELLTGRWPFIGSAMQVLGQKSLLDPITPSSINPAVPARLDEICGKMIARSTLDRYQKLNEVIIDLDGFRSQSATMGDAGQTNQSAAGPGAVAGVGRDFPRPQQTVEPIRRRPQHAPTPPPSRVTESRMRLKQAVQSSLLWWGSQSVKAKSVISAGGALFVVLCLMTGLSIARVAVGEKPTVAPSPSRLASGGGNELASLTSGTGAKPQPAAIATRPPPSFDAPGDWIDLLKLSAGFNWRANGYSWNFHLDAPISPAGLTLKPIEYNRFPLPVIIDGSYELEVEFRRILGQDAVCVMFPVGIHNVQLVFAGLHSQMDGVRFINGSEWSDSVTTRRPSCLQDDQTHRVRIRVEIRGDQGAFQIDWDDVEKYITWDGALSELINTDGSSWVVTMVAHPWVGSWHNLTTFSAIRARSLGGTIRPVPSNGLTPSEVAQLDTVSLTQIPPLAGTKVGWQGFLVNQIPLGSSAGATEIYWPMLTPEFQTVKDFYGAPAPSTLTVDIPAGAKSFSVTGYGNVSRDVSYSLLVDGQKLHDSGKTRAAEMAIDLPPGARTLELKVALLDGRHNFTYWCYPRFHAVSQTQITRSMLHGPNLEFPFSPKESEVEGGGVTHNQPIASRQSLPIHLEDLKPCHEFLFSHAPSSVTYPVPEGMTRFSAIGYCVGSEGVRFEVWADGDRVYQSDVAGIVPIQVTLPAGTQTCELRVDDLGDRIDDVSMWCYPRFHRK